MQTLIHSGKGMYLRIEAHGVTYGNAQEGHSQGGGDGDGIAQFLTKLVDRGDLRAQRSRQRVSVTIRPMFNVRLHPGTHPELLVAVSFIVERHLGTPRLQPDTVPGPVSPSRHTHATSRASTLTPEAQDQA